MLEKIYTGNGSETKYDLTFNYLTDSDINVGTKAQGADPDIYTTATLTTDYTISNKKVVFNSAPANNTSIRIRRITKVKDPRHLFHAGSSITADSLNKNSRQVLYALEERDLGADNTSDLALAVGSHNHIRVNSATNWEIVDGVVDTNALGANAVTAAKVADNAIENSHVADDAIGVAELSATGTPGDTKFLRGDNAWATPWHYTHPNHSGEVTSTADGAQVIIDNIVDENNLKITNAPTNDYVLTAKNTSSGTSDLTWVAPTGLIQVIQTLKTDTTSYNGQTEADIAGMTCTITPTSSSHKVLVILTVTASWRGSSYISLYRGSTKIGAGDAVTNKIDALYGGYPGSSGDGDHYFGTWAHTHHILDTPNTTSATTYKLTWRSEGTNWKYLNMGYDNVDHSGRGSSAITLMEII